MTDSPVSSIGHLDTLEKGYSEQYQSPSVQITGTPKAEVVIRYAETIGAIAFEGFNRCLVIDFLDRGVGPELYTKRALRRSLS